jgi:hypothetical protein
MVIFEPGADLLCGRLLLWSREYLAKQLVIASPRNPEF